MSRSLGDFEINMMAVVFSSHLVLKVILVHIFLLKIETSYSHQLQSVLFLTRFYLYEIRGGAISPSPFKISFIVKVGVFYGLKTILRL